MRSNAFSWLKNVEVQGVPPKVSAFDHALINRARGPYPGPYEEIFLLTFKAYGPNAVRFMRLKCQNKYFPYRPKSRLIRALLHTYINKIVYDEILLN